MKHACSLCTESTVSVLDFGFMPVANAFVSPERRHEDTYRYHLAVARCPSCHLVQLIEQPARERMFHAEYAYFSSTSRRMVMHFEEMAAWLHARAGSDPFVVELGSNDGILLAPLTARRVRNLGVEPSANVATAALDRGLRTQVAFFDAELAAAIREQDGPADVVCGANIFSHLTYLDSVMRGVCVLLGPRGILVFEDPYLPLVLGRNAFDQFYDEHAWYFTATAVAALARRYGLTLVDALPQATHGGSMRYVLARDETPSAQVTELLARESSLGFDTETPYSAFADRVERNCASLVELLERLRDQGKRVIGYGATAKSATVLNACRLGPEHIEAISDNTPGKQGRLTPGSHIPVVSHADFIMHYPDYALLFAWNHAVEILGKEQAFRNAGGRWIGYVPEVMIS
jgi:methylation protein EvaC